MDNRTQNVVIGSVAALAIGVAGLAMVRYQRASDVSGVEARPGVVIQEARRTVRVDDAVRTTRMPGDDASTTTREPAASSPEQAWLAALAEADAQLLVVGDHTVNNLDEWVTEWAALQDRPVDVVFWHEESDASYEQRIRLGETEGEADLVVWNAGRAGTSLADAAEDVSSFIAEGAEPDLAIMTLAGEGDAGDLDALLNDLEGSAGDPVPVAVVLSPPGWASADLVQTLADWAADEDLPVIDLLEHTQTSQPTPYAAAEAVQDAIEGWAER